MYSIYETVAKELLIRAAQENYETTLVEESYSVEPGEPIKVEIEPTDSDLDESCSYGGINCEVFVNSKKQYDIQALYYKQFTTAAAKAITTAGVLDIHMLETYPIVVVMQRVLLGAEDELLNEFQESADIQLLYTNEFGDISTQYISECKLFSVTSGLSAVSMLTNQTLVFAAKHITPLTRITDES